MELIRKARVSMIKNSNTGHKSMEIHIHVITSDNKILNTLTRYLKTENDKITKTSTVEHTIIALRERVVPDVILLDSKSVSLMKYSKTIMCSDVLRRKIHTIAIIEDIIPSVVKELYFCGFSDYVNKFLPDELFLKLRAFKKTFSEKKILSRELLELKSGLEMKNKKIKEISKIAETYKEKSFTDPLTGLKKYEYFKEQVLIKKQGKQKIVSLLNIKNFKSYSLLNGFEKSNAIIKNISLLVSAILKEQARDAILFKYKDDKYIILDYVEKSYLSRHKNILELICSKIEKSLKVKINASYCYCGNENTSIVIHELMEHLSVCKMQNANILLKTLEKTESNDEASA